eukprot:5471465-Lingulodinium_polyedra.AAC.1
MPLCIHGASRRPGASRPVDPAGGHRDHFAPLGQPVHRGVSGGLDFHGGEGPCLPRTGRGGYAALHACGLPRCGA